MNERPTVDPTFIFGIALVVALVFWYPALRAVMDGTLDITDGGIRFFLALALAWCGVYGVCTIVATYASQPPRRPMPPPATAAPAPQRRREDPPVDTADPTESNAA